MKVKISTPKLLNLFLYYWVPVVIWGTIIFSFSSVQTHPVSEVHWQDFIVKKLAHIAEYSAFATLLFRAYKKSGLSPLKSFYFALLTCLVYGITDEFHQSFTPEREPTVRDILIDTFGALIALSLIRDFLISLKGRLAELVKVFDIEFK